MRTMPWKKMTTFTATWAMVFSLTIVVYLWYMYATGSHVTDLGYVQSYAGAMTRPNDFNGGVPWTRQQADEYVRPYVELFWADVLDSAQLGIVVAGLVLLAGWSFIGLTTVLRTEKTSMTRRMRE